MPDPLSTYLQNRQDFYFTLTARIPHPRLRELMTAVQGTQPPDAEAASWLASLPADWPRDSFLSALILRDLLKKPGFGSILGRTTIAFTEALTRAEQVEDTGLLLFSHLATLSPASSSPYPAAFARHQAALAEILRLSDALRYHRLPL